MIIFETDGQANQPYRLNPCNYLNTKANAAKAAGPGDLHDRLRVGQPAGAVHVRHQRVPFATAYATTNIAGAASHSTDDVPGGCGPNENKDGDNYFCTPGSTDLEPVFRQVAAAAIATAHLID